MPCTTNLFSFRSLCQTKCVWYVSVYSLSCLLDCLLNDYGFTGAYALCDESKCIKYICRHVYQTVNSERKPQKCVSISMCCRMMRYFYLTFAHRRPHADGILWWWWRTSSPMAIRFVRDLIKLNTFRGCTACARCHKSLHDLCIFQPEKVFGNRFRIETVSLLQQQCVRPSTEKSSNEEHTCAAHSPYSHSKSFIHSSLTSYGAPTFESNHLEMVKF